MKKNILLITLLASLLPLSGCDSDIPKSFDDIVDTSTLKIDLPREQYTNSFGQEFIPEYWDSYGTGDPFVFRYDGMYYLYCSSPNYAYSVMGWKSKDLIHWEQCDNGVNQKGMVGEDDCLYTAFAPEVCHFNGFFYMCESRRGMGHFFLRSESPEGPFVPITDNRAQEIDGSLYVDSNENIYFLRASHGGIRILKCDENDPGFVLSAETRQIEEANLGAWTEGPGIFKKDGIYYMTYTGNNVTSAGYRVGYAYHEEEEEGDFFNSDGYKQGNIILLNTSDEFNGLGHSSNVMGPNMDSMYIVYHNLVSLNGPYRHYNLNRLMFNGTEMSVENASLYDNFVPEMPEFYTYDDTGLVVDGHFVVSEKASNARFTAELNVVGSNKAIFSFVDSANYAYVKLNEVSDKNVLTLNQVTNGVDEELESVTMNKTYNLSKNHSYRIAHDNGKVTVKFDDMEKISLQLETPFAGGKIGYETGSISSYTGFSNDSFDSSQRNEYKQNSAIADSYSDEVSNLPETAHKIYRQEIDGNGFDGEHVIELSEKGQHASFRTYFKENGFYGLDISIPVSYLGKKIGVRIDNEPVIRTMIPKYDVVDNVSKVHITSFNAAKGEHYISIYYMGDVVQFGRLDWYKTSNMKTTFTHNLASLMSEGAYYVNSWKIKKNGHYALSGNRQMLYIGDDTLRDYVIEADLTFDGATEASTAGFLLRASNPAFQTNDDINSVLGFYCGFNMYKSFITECHYNETIMGESSYAECDEGVIYRLKASCIGNEIKLYIDGKLQLTYVTASGPTHGRAAFYTDSAACIYQNVKVTTL